MRKASSFGSTRPFSIGAILIPISFAIQHRGILSTAKVQTIVGVAVFCRCSSSVSCR